MYHIRNANNFKLFFIGSYFSITTLKITGPNNTVVTGGDIFTASN